MSDDDTESLDTSSSFRFTRTRTPPFFTRSHHRTFSTFSRETPTDFSTPSPSTSFDVSSQPTPTQTDDPTVTDVPPSSTGTLDTPTSTSDDSDPSPSTSTDISSPVTLPTDLGSSSEFPPLDSSITIDSSTSLADLSTPTSVPDLSTFSSISSDDQSSSVSPASFDSTFTTSDLSLTTPSPSSTPSPTPSSTPSPSTPISIPTSSPTPSRPTPSPTPLSQMTSSRFSSPSAVITTSFPSFSDGPQSRTSTTSTGAVVAATTGAIALAIILGLLAILCRKRHLKKIRQRAGPDPFLDLDLDGELVTVQQPLIIGDNPGPAGAGYADPFTDDPRPRTRSLSATTGPTSLARSNNSFQAVVGSTPTPDPGGGVIAEYYNQGQLTNRRSPPPKLPPSGIARSRSHQSLPQVQTQLPPGSSIPRQSSPSFDAGAIAFIRNNDQTTDPSPTSPGHFSPGNAEDHRLISAFSAGSGLSPQYSSPVPPPNIDEMWRSSPDPITASSSYRPPIGRRQSFTPSVSGHVSEPDDTVVIAPMDALTQSPTLSITSPGSAVLNPHILQSRNFGSRPSPITEVTEIPSHSQEGSHGSGGTWSSTRSMDSSGYSPVLMKAQRVHLTPTALSIVSPRTASSASNYGDSLPSTGSTSQLPQLPPLPVPPLPQVQPLSLGKKRSAQGAT